MALLALAVELASFGLLQARDGVAVLFSAGLDSAVLLAHAAREHSSVQAVYVSAGLAWEAEERAMAERLLSSGALLRGYAFLGLISTAAVMTALPSPPGS